MNWKFPKTRRIQNSYYIKKDLGGMCHGHNVKAYSAAVFFFVQTITNNRQPYTHLVLSYGPGITI
jgi:hypothetical protein